MPSEPQFWTLPEPYASRRRSALVVWQNMQAQADVMLQRIARCCGAIPGCRSCNADEVERGQSLALAADAVARLVPLRGACAGCGEVNVPVDANSFCASCRAAWSAPEAEDRRANDWEDFDG